MLSLDHLDRPCQDGAAVPGEVLLKLDSSTLDHTAYTRLAQLIDELSERPESLELVLASGLVTAAGGPEDGRGGADSLREHVITQQIVAERDRACRGDPRPSGRQLAGLNCRIRCC